MKTQKPNELLIDKACELWGELLINPKFDALGADANRDDPDGSMTAAQGLAAMLASQSKPSPEQLEVFKAELKKLLSSKIRFENHTYIILDDGCYGYKYNLHVDYHPDLMLAMAAKTAGISDNVFPWKTSLYFYDNHVALSYGYGAESVNFYPFDGKWLVTTLSGSDITKIFEYLRGQTPKFTVIENT